MPATQIWLEFKMAARSILTALILFVTCMVISLLAIFLVLVLPPAVNDVVANYLHSFDSTILTKSSLASVVKDAKKLSSRKV